MNRRGVLVLSGRCIDGYLSTMSALVHIDRCCGIGKTARARHLDISAFVTVVAQQRIIDVKLRIFRGGSVHARV